MEKRLLQFSITFSVLIVLLIVFMNAGLWVSWWLGFPDEPQINAGAAFISTFVGFFLLGTAAITTADT